jgi:alkylglycerol monooxygenase
VKEDEEPVYGCLTPVNSLDPNKIYVQYWKMLYTDMMNTRSWKDKVKLWFMPLGWRPLDVKHIERHRVNEKTIKPFMVQVSPSKKIYLASQGVLGLILMGITINLNNHLDLLIRFSLIFLLWLMITSWGKTLEDKKEYGILEILRLIFTFIIFTHLMGESSQELNLIYVLAIIMMTGLVQLALHLKLRPLPQMKN